MDIRLWRYCVCVMLAVLSSCTLPLNFTYFQDAAEIRNMAAQDVQLIRVQPGDKLNIVVNSSDPMLSEQFTLSSSSASRTLGAASNPITQAGKSNSGQLMAYTVDEQGDIRFPVLGKLSVIGKTRTEVAAYIARRLVERDLVRDPVVTVEFVNLTVNVLGEVNRPGRIEILHDRFTLLDAIATAGDLTVNGLRENVMVCRQVDGEEQVYFVDLCSRQDLLESPAYYLQQNDVVYVSPTKKRMRDSSASGNTLSTPGFWISVISLLTTITALIVR